MKEPVPEFQKIMLSKDWTSLHIWQFPDKV